jgi:hypothetical protein
MITWTLAGGQYSRFADQHGKGRLAHSDNSARSIGTL